MQFTDSISLLVSVPVCSFRKGYAREYLETEEIPPPSTVYGFLLALIGEEDRNAYIGTEIAYAVVKKPELSVVMRTSWRVKDKKVPPGVGKNKRPDYQEILTGLEIAVFVQSGELATRLRAVCQSPANIDRFGGLSLGESRDLLNDILWNHDFSGTTGMWLQCDPEGEYPLPVWVDHIGSKKTIWKQFSIQEGIIENPDDNDSRWIRIYNTAD